jgi:hypothetical protein
LYRGSFAPVDSREAGDAQGGRLEPILKMRLPAGCGVAGRLKMLTYSTVCCAFSATGALPAAVIRYFKTGSCGKISMRHRG